jgi:RNA-binding protein YhbY
LLETALERVLNIKFRSIDDYLKFNIKYIKPHGSCNWFRNFKKIIGKGSIQSIAGTNPDFFTKKLYENNTSFNTLEQNLNKEFVLRNQFDTKDNFGVPQLLIPLKEKDEFVLPPNQLEYLNSYLKNIEEILIIGWKGTEEKFLKLLSDNLRDKKVIITTVCNGDNTINSHLQKAIPYANINSYSYKPSTDFKEQPDTFTNFIKTQIMFRNHQTYFFK